MAIIDPINTDRTKDIKYSERFLAAMNRMSLREKGRVLGVIEIWFQQVRKKGYIESRVQYGFPEKVRNGHPALFRFVEEGHDLPLAMVSARVRKRSWMKTISEGAFRREYLEVLLYKVL